MKKKIMLTCLIGALAGHFISSVITMTISLFAGDGQFYPVVPELIKACGSEINAVWIQFMCSCLYGAAWAGASFLWKIERWSLLRQTATHFLLCTTATFPIAYFMYWMPHSIGGILSYYALFLAIYWGIWTAEYSCMKREIGRMNERLDKRNGEWEQEIRSR